MGLFNWLKRLFDGKPDDTETPAGGFFESHQPARSRQLRPRLGPLRFVRSSERPSPDPPAPVREQPYRYAQRHGLRGGFLDLAKEGDQKHLEYLGLPVLRTPFEIADWLQIPPGQLAWLTHRYNDGFVPENARASHYHYQWKPKPIGGPRLIEAPKSKLKQVQKRILRDILDHLPLHGDCHGFAKGRSMLTNARPHVGQRVVLTFDLENFYAAVRYARAVAIFRSCGYTREAAIWLARLTTTAVPRNLPFPNGDPLALRPYLPRHLPQGASTSPALANLSAFSLDVRLSGLARSFDAAYTRYADDLTFSGGGRFLRSLSVFIPLVQQIVRSERFRVHQRKRHVLRRNQRQSVTGVVVNAHPNLPRDEFDRLKAILNNCLRHGPKSQNRENVSDFAAHLRGRVAHAVHLNATRGGKLQNLFERIDWSR